ncbi:hypothetical protein BD410DRAFT_895341 [Rickenella mellea]|uniref:ubiquitinyl hydrolase 1 n=1 Tax=Rickenella mellea TaxID=50990 RepID=A0A4Y7QGF1_9AGAM|nr:hypothetical protein BD410DRAFT_895341 [Rickenella mellea]
MPAVTVPSSSANRSSGPASPALSRGSSVSIDDLSVTEIKERAKSIVQQLRGASAANLIKNAREKATQGADLEDRGDLKNALNAVHMAANLAALVYETTEFRHKDPATVKEFVQFQHQLGNDLIPRTMKLEAKLAQIEMAPKPSLNGVNGSTNEDSSNRKVGQTIADRMRSLQDAGMSVTPTTKRVSRDLTINPTPSDPPRPAPLSRASSSSHAVTSPPASASDMAFSHSHRSSVGYSPHTLVSPTAFGPPSPTSSTASSPRLAHMNLSEFNQAFPSIDELDEMSTTASSRIPTLPKLPSVPTNKPGTALKAPLPSPSTISRFPSLPLDLDPGPRPASTPATPTQNAHISRPSSPTSHTRSHVAPTVSLKPSTISSPPRISASGVSSALPSEPHNHVVTNTIFPKTLKEYMDSKGSKVLLLDVRERDEFDAEHIKGSAVVCLEPYVLDRDGLTAEKLEDALSVAPRKESMVFSNRDKFQYVVMYDSDAETFTKPMAAVSRVIFENAFRKMLQRPPVILVGGLRDWKALYPRDVATESRPGSETISRASSASGVATSPDLTNGRATATSGGMDELPRRGESIKPPVMAPSSSTSAAAGLNGIAGQESQHEIWTPNLKQSWSGSTNGYTTDSSSSSRSEGRVRQSMDQIPEGSKSPEMNGQPSQDARQLRRKPGMHRPPSTSSIPSFGGRSTYEAPNGQYTAQSIMNQSSYSTTSSSSSSSTPIQYTQYPRPASSSAYSPSFNPSSGPSGVVSPPPQASINPSPLSRRRSDYIDQSEQAVSTFANRPSIDYPDLSSHSVLRPPPVAATPPLERQDNRPRIVPHGSSLGMHGSSFPKPPVIQSDYPVTYWPDMQVSTSGLKNLGNTCYMNATIQCLSATIPFARFFTDGRWKSAVNMVNPLGTKGHLTQAFASILHELWHEELPTLSPYTFRRAIAHFAKQFAGSEQHDSQEFLNFLLDGLHEDMNRVLQKPQNAVTPEREAELEVLPQQIASEQEWKIYRMRNDSIVVDYFQGQFRNRMECMTCKKTSTTYNAFMYLTLPIPATRASSKVTLQQCLDAFVQEEVMEKSDAWNCPNCKTKRKATKRLSLSRLPPVLLIHLKRFSFKGPFTDKLETVVDFPLRGLDLTNYMPPPMPPGSDKRQSVPLSPDDPRAQIPPYKYDLYGVTNHFGKLSSGHYTAFINSRGSWLYCDDSRVTQADAKEVVGRPAYVLFYKRSKT